MFLPSRRITCGQQARSEFREISGQAQQHRQHMIKDELEHELAKTMVSDGKCQAFDFTDFFEAAFAQCCGGTSIAVQQLQRRNTRT